MIQFGIINFRTFKNEWINKNNFPIDWTARHPLNKEKIIISNTSKIMMIL